MLAENVRRKDDFGGVDSWIHPQKASIDVLKTASRYPWKAIIRNPFGVPGLIPEVPFEVEDMNFEGNDYWGKKSRTMQVPLLKGENSAEFSLMGPQGKLFVLRLGRWN